MPAPPPPHRPGPPGAPPGPPPEQQGHWVHGGLTRDEFSQVQFAILGIGMAVLAVVTIALVVVAT